MLKPKALAQVLGQANSDGVLSTVLLNKEGVILAFAGQGENDATMCAAIASSVWNSYEKNGQDCLQDDRLRLVMLECDDGRVAVSKIANLLLCMYSKETVPIGLLKAKLEVLSQYLESPLSHISMN